MPSRSNVATMGLRSKKIFLLGYQRGILLATLLGLFLTKNKKKIKGLNLTVVFPSWKCGAGKTCSFCWNRPSRLYFYLFNVESWMKGSRYFRIDRVLTNFLHSKRSNKVVRHF